MGLLRRRLLPGRLLERAELILHTNAAFEDRQQTAAVLKDGDVRQRIAVDDKEIGQFARRQHAAIDAHRLVAVFHRPADHVQRRNADIVHVELQFLGVAPVREAERAAIVAQDDFHAGRLRKRQDRGHLVELDLHRIGVGIARHGGDHRLGEEQARREERAALDRGLDAGGVEPVAMVDDVRAVFDREQDCFRIGQMRADLCAALMRGLADHLSRPSSRVRRWRTP
jgi:hypothetical protein